MQPFALARRGCGTSFANWDDVSVICKCHCFKIVSKICDRPTSPHESSLGSAERSSKVRMNPDMQTISFMSLTIKPTWQICQYSISSLRRDAHLFVQPYDLKHIVLVDMTLGHWPPMVRPKDTIHRKNVLGWNTFPSSLVAVRLQRISCHEPGQQVVMAILATSFHHGILPTCPGHHLQGNLASQNEWVDWNNPSNRRKWLGLKESTGTYHGNCLRNVIEIKYIASLWLKHMRWYSKCTLHTFLAFFDCIQRWNIFCTEFFRPVENCLLLSIRKW